MTETNPSVASIGLHRGLLISFAGPDCTLSLEGFIPLHSYVFSKPLCIRKNEFPPWVDFFVQQNLLGCAALFQFLLDLGLAAWQFEDKQCLSGEGDELRQAVEGMNLPVSFLMPVHSASCLSDLSLIISTGNWSTARRWKI
jgi:hypothetical protein